MESGEDGEGVGRVALEAGYCDSVSRYDIVQKK